MHLYIERMAQTSYCPSSVKQESCLPRTIPSMKQSHESSTIIMKWNFLNNFICSYHFPFPSLFSFPDWFILVSYIDFSSIVFPFSSIYCFLLLFFLHSYPFRCYMSTIFSHIHGVLYLFKQCNGYVSRPSLTSCWPPPPPPSPPPPHTETSAS